MQVAAAIAAGPPMVSAHTQAGGSYTTTSIGRRATQLFRERYELPPAWGVTQKCPPGGMPRLPIAAAGSLHTLLALSRIPAVARAAEKTMQPEIDPLKEAAPERAAVGTRGLTKRFRSVARLARRARSVARRPPKTITCETAERTSHAVYRNR